MSGKKAVTKDYGVEGDVTMLFRMQDSRTLAEIDTLLLRQEKLRELLGEQKAQEIEENPDSFYNHERFRIWQAKARFRAFFATPVAVMAVSIILNGGRGGYDLIKKRWCTAVPAIAVTYASFFFVFHRLVGYNNQAYNEQAFAKNHKMLRNIIIKQ
jgi:hypothetical protein